MNNINFFSRLWTNKNIQNIILQVFIIPKSNYHTKLTLVLNLKRGQVLKFIFGAYFCYYFKCIINLAISLNVFIFL